MEPEQLFGALLLSWLFGSVLLIVQLTLRGRRLAAEFAARYPELYEALGRPRPGLLYSARRTRFTQFVVRRDFEQAGDARMNAKFEDYRRREARLLLVLLVSLCVVGLIILALRGGL
ncbi:MAG: hypothetical protein R3228_17345 [Halioglobus sp.]|nr:hypothetical protein [Halioglobus sp.]